MTVIKDCCPPEILYRNCFSNNTQESLLYCDYGCLFITKAPMITANNVLKGIMAGSVAFKLMGEGWGGSKHNVDTQKNTKRKQWEGLPTSLVPTMVGITTNKTWLAMLHGNFQHGPFSISSQSECLAEMESISYHVVLIMTPEHSVNLPVLSYSVYEQRLNLTERLILVD